jgi:hypothetical protein
VGKQQSYALLDDWIPQSRELDRDAALVELAHRYFASHGPATLADFVWWSGLTVKDASAAVDGARRHLAREEFSGVAWWSGDTPRTRAKPAATPVARLLPAYDEYTVAYKERAALLAPGRRVSSASLLSPVVIIDGIVAGTWKRTQPRGKIQVSTRLFCQLTSAQELALTSALRDFQDFVTCT